MSRADRAACGYDRLARHYQWLERLLFGEDLHRSRLALIDDLQPCANALILGDGDGRFLQEFCHRQPGCQVTSVDQSSSMLAQQRERTGKGGSTEHIEFVQQDATDHSPRRGHYDLLVVAFFLDCFTESELRECVPKWLAGVRPGGQLYVVEFRQPAGRWRRFRARGYLALMHAFFRWQTGLANRRLVAWENVLIDQPLSLSTERRRQQGMITSRLYRVGHEV